MFKILLLKSNEKHETIYSVYLYLWFSKSPIKILVIHHVFLEGIELPQYGYQEYLRRKKSHEQNPNGQ
mgnify:CR=1 FL=1